MAEMCDTMLTKETLFHEILMARKRVYAVGRATPLARLELPVDGEVFVKREDLSVIHSYKWRGAYNRMAQLSAEERGRGVVCASAGNHAQGVALAAKHLGIHARIYMPIAAPRMKQQAVRHHGGSFVELVLVGDTFDDAAVEAQAFAEGTGSPVIHPYDDVATMGGQGTLADEVVMSGDGPFGVAYLQIGGGGMAAAVACWLKAYYPAIRVVGVEGADQACMKAAIDAGGPVPLDHVDVFCDGTAVRCAGNLTYPLCRDLIDEFITVSNEEVCAAIEVLWETDRAIVEPAGAMGLAGLMTQRDRLGGGRALVVLAGANLDFEKLAWISQHAGIGAKRRRYFRLQMSETPGGLLHLLDTVMEGINIVDVQYGKTHDNTAWPVIGFEASPPELELLDRRLREDGIPHEDVTSQADVEFRIINYEPELFHRPFFMTHDFPERPGALRAFLIDMKNTANICYFNYVYTGEEVGHALIGFEFEGETQRAQFHHTLEASRHNYRALDDAVVARIL